MLLLSLKMNFENRKTKKPRPRGSSHFDGKRKIFDLGHRLHRLEFAYQIVFEKNALRQKGYFEINIANCI